MKTNDDIYYNALKSRDARFDGQFFTGVLTTGIFCRPICPAKTPLRKNVKFFENAASAFDAGLRPCLRCRPETAPESPAWAGTSTTVKRAISLIHKGVMDEGGVEKLALSLGISDRHLRRLFMDEIGTTPKAVADSKRLMDAKQLISDSTFTITDIAFASGYKSVRRFNEAYKASYGTNPSFTRRMNVKENELRGNETLRFSYKSAFDYENWFQFMAARTLKGLDRTKDEKYIRETEFGDIIIKNDSSKSSLFVSLPDIPLEKLRPIVNAIKRVTDVNANPDLIMDHLSKDRVLKPLTEKFKGIRLPVCFDPFEAALRAVTGQQVTVTYGKTLMSRLLERSGEAGLPSPSQVLKMDFNDFGMPTARIETLKAISTLWLEEGDTFLAMDYLTKMERLLSVKGIGPWSANYIALRGFGEPDAFPSGDSGIVGAWEKRTGKRLKAKEFEEISEKWRPWRGYAAMILWWSLRENDENGE